MTDSIIEAIALIQAARRLQDYALAHHALELAMGRLAKVEVD